MKTIDCRGMACPGPVLRTKEALETDRPTMLKVTVDNDPARQNVSRFLGAQDFTVSFERDGGNFHVIGKKEAGSAPIESSVCMVEEGSEKKKIMVMVATDRLGRGDDDLGEKLMVNFLKTLKEMGRSLWRLVFVNNGVKLTVKESAVLSDLKELEEAGILILVCGTCLEHFHLLHKKQAGQTTNMLDIVTAMQVADKVITL